MNATVNANPQLKPDDVGIRIHVCTVSSGCHDMSFFPRGASQVNLKQDLRHLAHEHLAYARKVLPPPHDINNMSVEFLSANTASAEGYITELTNLFKKIYAHPSTDEALKADIKALVDLR